MDKKRGNYNMKRIGKLATIMVMTSIIATSFGTEEIDARSRSRSRSSSMSRSRSRSTRSRTTSPKIKARTTSPKVKVRTTNSAPKVKTKNINSAPKIKSNVVTPTKSTNASSSTPKAATTDSTKPITSNIPLTKGSNTGDAPKPTNDVKSKKINNNKNRNSSVNGIPISQMRNSSSNDYYYNNRGSNSFLSNFLIYRMLTPNNRTYNTNEEVRDENGKLVNLSKRKVAPAYTGIKSAKSDIIAGTGIIGLLIAGVFVLKRRFNS